MNNLNREFAFGDFDMKLNSYLIEEQSNKLERIKRAVSEDTYEINSKKLANILIPKLIMELAQLDCPVLYLLPCSSLEELLHPISSSSRCQMMR